MLSMSVNDISALKARLAKFANKVAELKTPLALEGSKMIKATEGTVPIDTGALSRSLTYQVSPIPGGIELRAGTWGPGFIPYSLDQELNEEYNHPKGGGPHFMRNAFFSALPGIIDIITKEFKSA